MKILGDKKRIRYDEGLIDVVNRKAANGELDEAAKEIDSTFVFGNVEFEPCVNNESMTFDKSLISLKERGYQRHARPLEIMSVLFDVLENPNSKYKSLVDNMIPSPGEEGGGACEWVSLAFRKKGNILEGALDPENLVYDKSNHIYVTEGKLISGEVRKFDIGEAINYHRRRIYWRPLRVFSDDLVEFLYGRKFAELPEIMRSDKKEMLLKLPSKANRWLPVMLSGRTFMPYGDSGSRGVRIK